MNTLLETNSELWNIEIGWKVFKKHPMSKVLFKESIENGVEKISETNYFDTSWVFSKFSTDGE